MILIYFLIWIVGIIFWLVPFFFFFRYFKIVWPFLVHFAIGILFISWAETLVYNKGLFAIFDTTDDFVYVAWAWPVYGVIMVNWSFRKVNRYKFQKFREKLDSGK
jgi:hypothetical protein